MSCYQLLRSVFSSLLSHMVGVIILCSPGADERRKVGEDGWDLRVEENCYWMCSLEFSYDQCLLRILLNS